MAVPPMVSGLGDPLNSVLQVSGWGLYFIATNGLLFQLWRAPPPGTLAIRCVRVAFILILGAPALTLLVGYMVIMKDVEIMGLPIAAAPFAIIAPLWVLALNRHFKRTPTPLSEIF
jgi:hypothetical protein